MKQSLVYLIEAAVHTECGLRRLVGDWPEPTIDELEAALVAFPRALRRPDIPFAEVLAAIGGWGSVMTGVERWRRANHWDWNLFIEVALTEKRPSSRFRPKWGSLVEKYGEPPANLTKHFRLAIHAMANEILAGANSSRAPVKKQRERHLERRLFFQERACNIMLAADR